jgi:hypothetical protein
VCADERDVGERPRARDADAADERRQEDARNVELELFLPKSDERLNSRRATGGDVRGKRGDGSEEGKHGDVC